MYTSLSFVYPTFLAPFQFINIQIREGLQSDDSLLLTTTGADTTHPHALQPIPATPMTPHHPHQRGLGQNTLVSVATPVHPSVKSLMSIKTPTQQLAFDVTQVDKISGMKRGYMLYNKHNLGLRQVTKKIAYLQLAIYIRYKCPSDLRPLKLLYPLRTFVEHKQLEIQYST